MKKILLIFVLFLFFIFNVGAINNVNAYVVMEVSSKRILSGKNIDKQMLIASTAKILTAITVIENYDLDEVLRVNKCDVDVVGSKVYFKVDEELSRRDLLYALMLRSANDAANILSNNNSKEFIRLMNDTAKRIGMYNSVFENASGLDEREFNISTAYDMGLLSVYASKNEIFKSISSVDSYRCVSNLNTYYWVNKHKLVKSLDEFVWGTTGYTKKSGRILVSNYCSSNMNVVVVTINDSDDWNNHKRLVSNLDKYDFKCIFNKGLYDISMDVTYFLYVKESIVIPVKDNENIKLMFILYKDKALLNVMVNGSVIAVFNIDVYDKCNIDPDILIKELY